MSVPEIISIGSCAPEKVVTNDMLAEIVDTSDEWIYSRTGIHSRRFCVGETSLDLISAAARSAMERAGVTPEDIGVCLVATITPDYATPSAACLLQKELGLYEDTICFDLNAACAGFIYGMQTAGALLQTARRPYGLVVGCEVLSKILDMTDRSTCVLFGDGAGAAVVRSSETSLWHAAFGSRGDPVSIWVQGVGPVPTKIHMEGQPVFRFAVEVVEKTIRQLLDEAGLTLDDIDYVVCHQANSKIIDHVAKKLKARPGLFYKNIDHFGNTSAASIPLAMDELYGEGLLKPGMRVLVVGFGGGLTWAGALFRFGQEVEN